MNNVTSKNKLAQTARALLLLNCFFLQGQAKAGATSSTAGLMTLNDQAPVGYLTVFSSTQETSWGDGTHYYVHTGYHIYDSTGKAMKWVDNHYNSIDENPEKIELTPGKYIISAPSDAHGYVKVPVMIKAAQTTAVHLES